MSQSASLSQIEAAPKSATFDEAAFKGKLSIALAAAIIQHNHARLLELSKILTENFSEEEIQKMWRPIKQVVSKQEEAWLACILTRDPASCPI